MSRGTTFGLAYAETHPSRVDGLVLALVTTTSRREVEWITHDIGRVFPVEWERFAATVPESHRHLSLCAAYCALLSDPDPAVRDRAATEWCRWEDAHVSLAPGYQPNPRFRDRDFRLRFARLTTHYWSNAAFLEDGRLLRNLALLEGKPAVLIHGRHDVSSPLETAWQLSRAWRSSRLVVLDDVGHGGPSISNEIVQALELVTR